MPSLHITKVAVGCGHVDALRERQRSRLRDGYVPILTRFLPKRADALIGGSLYWIIKHRFTVRQTIFGFEPSAADQRTIIRLAPELVPVQALPKRAHQGWRYLDQIDAPPDLDGQTDILEALPPHVAQELLELALI
ncbi:DUF1489 family protein [Sphingosinicella terrae]|jgi:hypothetical protein|uniref:DUF1489 family protein n=1 Tax=Sphingosinicella terrae TaxID=2172047 RepID=UPI000E0CF3A0|nr:DUF1489 domain-containing protein [Sphingosinicella terrae]